MLTEVPGQVAPLSRRTESMLPTIVQAPEDSVTPLNQRQGVVPRPGRHRRPMTSQKTQKDKAAKRKKVLLTILTVVVLLGILVTAGYFIKKLIDSKYFFCKSSVKFIPLELACDGKEDCSGGEDELTCVSSFKANTTYPVRLTSRSQILQVWSPGPGWRSVCSDDWTPKHTQTACKQLGYTSNPSSSNVPVSTLLSSIRKGPFTAVRSGTSSTPIHQATIDRSACRSGSVVSLSCSDCGEVGNQDRIVGGTNAFIEDWPWQVSLQQAGHHTCGGSLVSTRWVVTAAHCFTGSKKDLSRWKVVSGRTFMGSVGGVSVDRIVLHGSYDAGKNDYDIALMRLSSPIKVGESRKPVCLPPNAFGLPAQSSMSVTGWGYLEENGQVSTKLQMANINLIDQSKCVATYGNLITERMICAGFMTGKVDACQGDSGGPLVHFTSAKWHLIGVVSWGIGCGREGKPGVYCKTEEMLNWIHTVFQKHR